MIEKDLDKVLNYMKQYVENIYEHDSEPMLTWKDLKLVLNEIKRLNNIINKLNNAYCKVITKCEEMINNRFYMNDIAIKKYADEIKDICKYYVVKTKELKGSENNE